MHCSTFNVRGRKGAELTALVPGKDASKQKLFKVQSSHKQLDSILNGISCVREHLHPVIDHKLEKYTLNMKYLPVRSSFLLVKAESMTQEVPLNAHLTE